MRSKLFFVIIGIATVSRDCVSAQTPTTPLASEFYSSKIISRAGADFDNNGNVDSCFVIDENEQGTNIRLLVVYFRQGKNYKKSVQTANIFGDSKWGVQGQDPFKKLEARKNTIVMHFMSGGSGARQNFIYTFKYLHSYWFLTKFEYEDYELPIGDYSEKSITDYIKGEMKTTICKGKKKTEKLEKLPKKPLEKLVDKNAEKEFE